MAEVVRIPILQIEEYLVASIQTALHDRAAEQFRDDLLARIYETKAKGLILDLTAMDVVDSFIARIIGDVAEMASLMGTTVVVTGLQPAVAVTLVELGVEQEKAHVELGEQAARVFDRIYLVGKTNRTEAFAKGLEQGGFKGNFDYVMGAINPWEVFEKMEKGFEWVLMENDLPDSYY